MTWADFDPAAGRYRLLDGGWLALPTGTLWSFEMGHGSPTPIQTVTFLPDGTGSGAKFTIRSGIYSSVHQLDWLTGAIHHAHP
ncbi:hypothetical protein [Microvirga zambiensis]|uniref:hypothetical protein n=1 Tax=Microvirga zambiensis TaxID=1402137 RepID=UPI001FE4958F|nr:hypothetical protein [Microvirga zambiensis]